MYTIASIFKDIQYGDKGPAVSTLLNTADTKEVRIVFRAGQEMKEHKAPFPIVVAVIEGRIDFGVGAEQIVLEKGMMIALDANRPHALTALEDSVVRLSLNKSDSIDRPKEAAG